MVHGMLLQTFLTSAKKIDQTIILTGATTAPNQLLTRFLSELMRCTNITPLLSVKHHTMCMYLRNHGFSQVYTVESVTSISKFLTDGGAGPTLQLSFAERKFYPDSGPSLISSSSSSFNKPVMENMVLDSGDTPVSSPSLRETPMDDVDETMRGVVAPLLTALEFDIEDETVNDLMFNTMRLNFHTGGNSRPGPCDVCNSRHDADTCRVRGPSFLPDWLLKNVKQYNNRYGDKPKVPPPNIPLPPMKPKLGSSKSRLEKRIMEVT